MFRFDQATLDALYPSHGRYVSEVNRAASALQRAGFLLPRDARRLRRAAAHSPIGLELALVLPPILWRRRRRRRRRD